MSFDFSNYTSVFSWRYGSSQMRHIFSEKHKYQLWREIWVSLARAQHAAGLISDEELIDLQKFQQDVDINEILENEKKTKHDVVAAIQEFASKAKIGGGKIHLGATSMDIVDNTDTIRIKEALTIIEQKILLILSSLSKLIERYADLVCIGFTHLQPAEPTTVGYRLSFYAQDLLLDYHYITFVLGHIKAKGMKGAVGTQAGYTAILEETAMDAMELEGEIMAKLGIEASLVSTQISTRKYDYLALSALGSVASSLAKFAVDLRILQSPAIGEWAEPFEKKQVGSSAMPFKRNPINAEKICSLARYVSSLQQIALENATHSYLERTLDDSANKRIIIPDGFLATDEIVNTAQKLISGLVINKKKIAYNLSQYAPFAATEKVLMEIVKRGANRQTMHEILRDISLKAWEEVENGGKNPMEHLLITHPDIKKYLNEKEIKKLADVTCYIGTASKRAILLTKEIKKLAAKDEK